MIAQNAQFEHYPNRKSAQTLRSYCRYTADLLCSHCLNHKSAQTLISHSCSLGAVFKPL